LSKPKVTKSCRAKEEEEECEIHVNGEGYWGSTCELGGAANKRDREKLYKLGNLKLKENKVEPKSEE
jgi:hypothetical protein